MDAIKNLMERRSIRKFKDVPVEREKLDKIVMCAKHSPTGMNRQNRRFTILTDKKDIKKLYEALAKLLNLENYRFYDCKALIIVTVPKDAPLGEVDSACALENIYLAAHALDLGSVWINQLRNNCNDEGIRPILDEFKIPEDHICFGMSAIGYPDEIPKEKERTEEVYYV